MKFVIPVAAIAGLLLAMMACSTPGEPRYASPPPGSHSPFAAPSEADPQRSEPEPEPDAREEEEPDEPIDRM